MCLISSPPPFALQLDDFCSTIGVSISKLIANFFFVFMNYCARIRSLHLCYPRCKEYCYEKFRVLNLKWSLQRSIKRTLVHRRTKQACPNKPLIVVIGIENGRKKEI